MQLRDSQRAAEDLANELDIVDDQDLDTLRADEMFAAWAYIYQQADLYAADVEETLAGDAMKEAARVAARGARDVAVTRAEELLGWEPRHTLQDGIDRTVDWYLEYRDEDYVRDNLETLLHER